MSPGGWTTEPATSSERDCAGSSNDTEHIKSLPDKFERGEARYEVMVDAQASSGEARAVFFEAGDRFR